MNIFYTCLNHRFIVIQYTKYITMLILLTEPNQYAQIVLTWTTNKYKKDYKIWFLIFMLDIIIHSNHNYKHKHEH